ncbi:MAG TPA: hypothetical protein VGA45_14255 [Actinomycetota bacterium]
MRVRSMLAAAVAAVALILPAAPALAATPFTAGHPTALAQQAPLLVDVRTAHHPGFDRITFEFRGPRPSHRIGYVSRLVEDASGRPVELAGDASINVVFQGANAHNPDGSPSVAPRRFKPNLPSLKEVAQIGDFEAVVTYGLGVDHRVPFKVLELSNPSRIAIDVSTASGSGSGAASGGTSGGTPEGPGSLPFTGSRADHLLLEGLGLLAVGMVTLLLAWRTRRA